MLTLAIFTAGSALCGLAWSLPILILFRVAQGIGGAALFPLAMTLLYREFPPHQRGLASGLLGIATLLAPAVGPTLGGYFVTYVDWRLIFFVNVPIGIIGLLLAALFLREVRAETRTPFDVPGFVLASTGLAAVLYALSDASIDGWGSGKVLGFLLGGLFARLLFARRAGPFKAQQAVVAGPASLRQWAIPVKEYRQCPDHVRLLRRTLPLSGLPAKSAWPECLQCRSAPLFLLAAGDNPLTVGSSLPLYTAGGTRPPGYSFQLSHVLS
ncbi:MFS transporter [Thermogemmatispora tikiterensis]|uniref:Major facilitator superfamily (MFS) profile domain-containing protein n=1 Tax=Thermogemmatispora tikiterensis TaxID=1825093 RepID=A0A328VE04_9CHLR|nr:hypothetical protein A4R35_00450 [Thermogemmatispora tikiterensis]